MADQTEPSVVVQGLRWWAQGAYAEEAAVELLVRAFGGRFAAAGWPWVRSCERPGWWRLDADEFGGHTDVLSSGEQRVLAVVEALVSAGPLLDVGGILAGVDRVNLVLILAAFAHAGGSHEHMELIATEDGVRYGRLAPLVSWPDVEIGAVS
ncbi:hypothetical protein GCM10009841_30810 [Microlunatus panaciterrae]|uniref:Uncharacterized protein n=1 Tax=Microlunatus panaciterrae TaxID=400768 RepID=A0ABS2RFH0_9ACTN|nr:hypothetical protein [Microlunatus panaciterrae]MBM7797741.1 hypothetical protein [Microlunatus panaciterrae]